MSAVTSCDIFRSLIDKGLLAFSGVHAVKSLSRLASNGPIQQGITCDGCAQPHPHGLGAAAPPATNLRGGGEGDAGGGVEGGGGGSGGGGLGGGDGVLHPLPLPAPLPRRRPADDRAVPARGTVLGEAT